jgi:4-hydroxybenzoyl-CoA thioesterase
LRFGDCDPSGIAYFPSYLNILVGVVEDFFTEIGKPWAETIRAGMGTPTVRLDVTFVKPGVHGDLMQFAIRVKRIGRSSIDLEHTVSVEGETIWTANQRMVATSLDSNSSCPWPDDFRAAFAQHLETDDAHNPAT